jgi:hypothetical protein
LYRSVRRADRARKVVIEDEKFDDVIRRDTMALTVRFHKALAGRRTTAH